MGSRSLEASLRARLLVVVGAVLVGVAGASYAITAHVLQLETDAEASTRARGVLRMLAEEIASGDKPEDAAREVLLASDADDVSVILRTRDGEHGAEQFPASLRALAPGECGEGNDARGEPWRACAARLDDTTAIAAFPVSVQRAALRRIGVWFAAIVVLALLAVALVTRVALRRLFASLSSLATWSSEVVGADDLPPAPRGAKLREIEQLADSFDELTRRLVDAIRRERASSAHIAHELRTALTAMHAELEAMRPVGGDAAVRLLGDVERMSRVIDAILLLSKPARAMDATTVVNLADCARDLASPSTSLDVPDEALVRGDPRLVELALRNLLDNAVRYTSRPATEVRISREGDAIRVAVLDEGPGLDEDAREKMFERFWRAAHGGHGSGLGLALVRAVAESHGGRSEARPNPGGRGLEVSLTFGHVVGWHEAPPR